MVLTDASGVKARISVLRRGPRHRQHRRQMHDATEEEAAQRPHEPTDHEQPFRATAGIGPSFIVVDATPIGVS